ncbi:PREDICTED: amphiphysin isoform X2 [Habropoda laboriosa]|nr:PREDICTED: amphiphysin isoform X2 [Habropoda laboriosa]
MAESKGALIAKTVQKHAGRAKEKFLQNLGKVDRTADDIFDEHLQNFMRQQNAANRLQKEFNNYIRCVRGSQMTSECCPSIEPWRSCEECNICCYWKRVTSVQAASKTLMDSLNEIYESQWTGHDLLYVQAQNLDMLWQDFTHKLADQVLVPLNTYQSQFPEMRKKIDKRGRKLVDYDSQRHNFQSLQCNPRKRDELKVSRGKELLEEAKRTYEQLNSELHDELPALYDSRVLFLVTNLQTLFAAEQVFHTESAKVYSELEAIVDKLANESQRGSYTLKKTTEPQSPKSPNANSSLIINTQPAQNNVSPAVDDSAPVARNTSPTTQLNGNANSNANSNDNSLSNQDVPPQSTVTASKRVEELYDIPVGATTDNLPPGVLYRVKATYKYRCEDADELSFDVGDIIRVVEYDDPEEQEQGWLMGIKEGTDEKGMFPANFTKPL